MAEVLEQVVVELATNLHAIAAPKLGAREAAAIVGEAHSGDYTYAIDEAAEHALADLVEEVGSRHRVRLAYYSEDRGLVEVHADPQFVLVVDPIDGTRPAVCGLESSCVSVALAELKDGGVTLSDVQAACLVELKSGDVLSSRRGAGVHRVRGGQIEQVNGARLSPKTDVSKIFWAAEMCGRPSQATQAVLGDLTNASSFAGACFVFNSSSFAISRVVLGQLDGYIDFYAALLRRAGAERWAGLSKSLFHGKLFGLFPYDIAAAAFIAEEAGAFVSDAFGQPLGSLQLLDSSSNAITSAVVAGTPELGRQMLNYIDRGFGKADVLTLP